jgi:hypothetical protein
MYRASWRWKRRGSPARWSKVHLFTEPVTPYIPGKPSQVALCGIDVPASSAYSELDTSNAPPGTPCKKCLSFSKGTNKEMNEQLCGLSKGPEPIWIAAPAFSPFLATITPDYPVAAWHGSVLISGQGRNGQIVVAICDHIMQSSIESADSWFKNVRQ